MTLDGKTRKRLKRIAHHLQPVVTVGERSLSDGLLAEVDRALTDHELIKVRLQSLDRTERTAQGAELADRAGAEVVQKIGKVLVLYRASPEPDPALSNVRRYAEAQP